MPLAPFKRSTKSASYADGSGPNSKGRMPQKMTDPKSDLHFSVPAPKPAPEVDGSLRGHDTNYKRVPPMTHAG